MKWIQKIWPRRTKAKSKPEEGGLLAPSYGQDLQHPDELIDRANKRAIKGDLEGAIADFDTAIELNPAKATTFYNRGYLNNLAGNHEQALQDCSEAITLLPDYDEAFYQRGVAHQALGNIDAAAVDFSEVLRLNPFSIKAYYKRASCYSARDDVQGALADYTQAILRVPKDANAYLQRGIFLTKLQEYRTAVEDFSSALSFNPKSADAYYHRGYCFAEIGNKEKATQDFNQAMLYDPSQRVADYNRSYALGILKETKNLPPASSSSNEPAIIQADDAIVLSLNADDSTVLATDVSEFSVQKSEVQFSESPVIRPPEFEVNETLNLPDLNSGLDADRIHHQPDLSSEPTFREDRTNSPTQDVTSSPIHASVADAKQTPNIQVSGALVRQTDIEALFAKAQYESDSEDFQSAVVSYSELIEYEPNNARAYLGRGRCFNAMGLGEDATSDLDMAVHLAKQKSLDLMKDYSVTLSDALADLKGGLEWESQPSSALVQHVNNQSIEGAILKYSQAIHRNPLDVHSYFERAKSRALLGDLEGAIADYTRTIALDEQYRDAYYKRGMLLASLGDTDGATRDMNKAILRKPLLPAARSLPAPSSGTPLKSSTFSDPAHLKDLTVREATELTTKTDKDIELSRHERPPSEKTTPIQVQSIQSSPLEMPVQDAMDDDLSHDAVEFEEETDEVIPTYFSDLVLEPCDHAGNDPANRFCIHCGQPIQPTL